MDFLKVQGLSKSFGGLKAVNNFDFTVNEGEIIGLIGPNGSGKTTTLNLITGFLKPILENHPAGQGYHWPAPQPRVPTGSCQNLPDRQTFPGVYSLAKCDGRPGLWPAPDQQYGIAAENQGVPGTDRLGKEADALAKDLSLMQRKRLELARALATKPQLLLLDELMAGLNHPKPMKR